MEKTVSLKRYSTSEDDDMVVGSTNLYDENGMRMIPAPTADPNDPLNLPQWRKIAAIMAVACFGALALSAEVIIGAMIPVFVLEYAGIDPKILVQIDVGSLLPPGTDPLKALASLPGPPLWKTSLLSSLPLLTNGISSYFLIPLSIGIGRRPVLLLCGTLAWIGGLWAGFSHSLNSHIAARCVQAIGAGAVEALIPLLIQDIIFIHQRNRAMASIWAAQGFIIVVLGIGTPAIVGTLGWRFLYYMTSGMAFIVWIFLIIFVPETRFVRSQAELAGKSTSYIHPGENRPRLDTKTYGERTRKSDFGLIALGYEWSEAFQSMIDTVRAMFLPVVAWGICIEGIFISIQIAAAQTGSTLLIAKGWKFKILGLGALPIVVATVFVWLLSGYAADKISNFHARRSKGRREPEAHLITLTLPLVLGVLGAVVFGYAGQYIMKTHWIVLLFSIFLISLGFLSVNTIVAVYAIEAYPQMAGPVLVNISSWRCIVGFAMSFRVTSWVEQRGFLGSFSIYAVILAILSCMLPFMYVYGKRLRKWTSRYSERPKP